MNSKTKEEKIWNRIAIIYDRVENNDMDIFKSIISKTREYLNRGDKVIDFGCGTGIISNEIAENVAYVRAIDISSRMLEFARKKADERNIKNVYYDYTDLFDNRYKSGSFDVILAFYILHFFDESRIVFRRMHELLKPGGLIISATPCLGERPCLSRLLWFLYKLGLVPKIKSFIFPELLDSMAGENFKIIKKECLKENSGQYFIAAIKN